MMLTIRNGYYPSEIKRAVRRYGPFTLRARAAPKPGKPSG